MAKVSGWIADFAVVIASIAVCSATLAADVSPDMRAAGMKEAPAVVAAAKLPCTVADARKVGTDKDKTTYYEVACKEGGGYVLGSKGAGATPTSFDCLITSGPGADGKPNPLGCVLPGNANPARVLQAMAAQAGAPCQVEKGRYMGSSTDKNLYEAACASGAGYVLLAPRTGGGAPIAENCLALAAAANGNIKCELTTPAQELGQVDALAAASGKCAVKDKRYVMTATDGTDYFEVSCADGKGYVLHASKDGKLAQTIPCANASYVGGGCSLTDARQAMTQQNGVYSDLAKKAGFDCNVSKYAAFPTDKANLEVVELACSNRPDGGVGIFPAGGQPRVVDCLRSLAEGYKCSYTPQSAAYPKLSADLKSVGKGSCVVNGARPLGHGANGEDFVEVACADGAPGWVIAFPPNGRLKVTDLMNCAQAASMAGGCQLPTNRKS